MTLVRSLSTLATLALASSLLVVVGCGGKSIGDDLTSTPDPNDPNDPRDPKDPPPQCAELAPACDPGDEDVGSEKGCGTADYCYSRTETCNGTVVWCAHRKAQCTAAPACDDGDKPVSSCPSGGPSDGSTCYPRTICGSTIFCLHHDACKALPLCDAGDKEVIDIKTCQEPGASCYSRTACNFTIWCSKP